MRWSWNVQGSPLRSVQGVAAASTSFNDNADPWKDYDCSVACSAGGAPPTEIGGANARMVRAWLDWQLKGKSEPEALFLKSDLTGYDQWTIKHKNFK